MKKKKNAVKKKTRIVHNPFKLTIPVLIIIFVAIVALTNVKIENNIEKIQKANYIDAYTTAVANGNERTVIVSLGPKNFFSDGSYHPIDTNFKQEQKIIENKNY